VNYLIHIVNKLHYSKIEPVPVFKKYNCITHKIQEKILKKTINEQYIRISDEEFKNSDTFVLKNFTGTGKTTEL
jgi:hypothetical protein